MKKERRTIVLSKLQLNTGQLDWLPRNPRQWTKEDRDRTVKSIIEDPDYLEDRPLLVVPADPAGALFVIFAGNLRGESAPDAGLREVPCVVYFPVTEDDRETVRRRAMKDNGQFGSWDPDILANEWDFTPEELVDMGAPDWLSSGDTDASASGMGGGSDASASEDDFDEDKDEIHVICAKGDIWQLGDHRLMCGDSVDLEQVKTLMGGAKADMVFTDPPYGTTALSWDNDIDLKKLFDIAFSICQEKAQMVITGAQPFVTDVINAGRERFRYEIIWKKTQPAGFFHANKAPLRIHENLLVFGKGVGTYNPQKSTVGEGTGRVRHQSANRSSHYHGNHESEYVDDGTRYPTSVIEVSNWNGALFGNTDNAVKHPTQKPVELVSTFLKTYSNEGEIVLDMFGGSGTTLIAAEQLGRKCYMMELDPHYCDVIIARWEKLTGRKAIKVAG